MKPWGTPQETSESTELELHIETLFTIWKIAGEPFTRHSPLYHNIEV